MRREPRTTFLDPETYRGRRLQDAARVLPVLGVILFLLPLLWLSPEGRVGLTASVFVYVFLVWALLIVVAAFLSRGLSPGEDKAREGDEGGV